MVEVKCNNCGILFNKTNYKYKRSKLHFCCLRCKQEYGIIGNEYILDNNIAKIVINSNKYGVKYAIIDIENIDICKKYTWSLRKDNNNFYAVSNLYDNNIKKTIILHRLILNCDNKIIDHINRDGLDNRKNNLRICSKSENRFNSRLNKNNTSGFNGVYLNKNTNKYQAKIKINGKEKSLGYFKTATEANNARLQAQQTDWEY